MTFKVRSRRRSFRTDARKAVSWHANLALKTLRADKTNIAPPESEWLNNLRTICSAVYLMVLKASQASRSGNKTSSSPTEYTQDTACLHADKTTLLCLRANGSTISARFAQQFIWWFSKHHRHHALATKQAVAPTEYTQDTACLHADKTTLLCLRANGSTISARFAQQFIWWFSKHHRHHALATKQAVAPQSTLKTPHACMLTKQHCSASERMAQQSPHDLLSSLFDGSQSITGITLWQQNKQ